MFSGEIKSPKPTEFTIFFSIIMISCFNNILYIVASMQAFKMAERSNTFTYVYHY